MNSVDVRTLQSFEKQAKRLRKKYPSVASDIGRLAQSLENDPTQGTGIGKGCYKVRMAIGSKQQGKSGGARVITYVKITTETVYLLTLYDKSEKGDLEPGELDELLAQLPADE